MQQPMKSRRRASGTSQAIFKLILTGDSATGKSCLLNRYVKDKFQEEYHVTIGAEFQVKTIKIDENYRVKLQIWDTAGQQTFRSIIKTFYRNSAAVLLVYDITRAKTFNNLKLWLDQAKEHSPKNAIFILMGTHLDLQQKRQVTQTQAENWVTEHGISLFFQTSAKTDLNVTHAFQEIAKQLFLGQVNKRRGSQIESIKFQSVSLAQSKQKPAQKKCCN